MGDEKEDLLKKIVELKKVIDSNTNDLTLAELEVADFKLAYESAKEVMRRAQEELNNRAQIYTSRSGDVTSLSRCLEVDTKTLDAYNRQLSRLLDAEYINSQYKQMVEEFKNSLTGSPWRKENRTDNRGAMPHQIEGAIQMAIAKQGLLGDKRGLGKTLTSLIWADFVEAQKMIVLCPADLVDNWIDEIKLWAPHRRAIFKISKMGRYEREAILQAAKTMPNVIIICNFEAWRRDDDLIDLINDVGLDTLIEDEAHKAKNANTVTCQGVVKIRFGMNVCPKCGITGRRARKAIKQTDKSTANCVTCNHQGAITEFSSIKNVLPMTGTPILNKPQELWPQLHLIDPVNFPSENAFLSDFCTKSYDNRWKWQWGAEKKLATKIGPRFIARDRKSAGVIIPPNRMETHKIDISDLQKNYNTQYTAYQQVKEYAQLVMDKDKEQVMSMPVFLTVLMRLRQVLTWPGGIELKEYVEELDEKIVVAKFPECPSIKVDKAVEIIQQAQDEGDRVVLFSQFSSPLHAIKTKLDELMVTSAVYEGSTPIAMRNLIRHDFDPKTAPVEPRYQVALCNYKAAGTGLNFNAAQQSIMLDREWSPGMQEQAEGRIDRIGTVKDTVTHYIDVEPSVDSWMLKLQTGKSEMISGFNDSHGQLMSKFMTALNDGDI